MAQQEGLYSLVFLLGHVHHMVEVIQDVLEVINVPQWHAAARRLAVPAVVYTVDVVARIQQALGDVIISPRMFRDNVRQNHRTAWVGHLLLAVVDLDALAVSAVEVTLLIGYLLFRDSWAPQYIWFLVCRGRRCRDFLGDCPCRERARYRNWCRQYCCRRQASGYVLLHHHCLLVVL